MLSIQNPELRFATHPRTTEANEREQHHNPHLHYPSSSVNVVTGKLYLAAVKRKGLDYGVQNARKLHFFCGSLKNLSLTINCIMSSIGFNECSSIGRREKIPYFIQLCKLPKIV
ncbi:hypothetical protein RchiOBHm_Chr2g0098821 [Rosa chinensis]|uniref:Uncharacterized protein n=1 Tax=Rosa chinensis TaxID=74649 RepID=A0A2P6RLP9_ROSCH|nr:hypothetical protein RchiOBHm_Chr2g0098821 [Rosa chinensis]